MQPRAMRVDILGLPYPWIVFHLAPDTVDE